MKEGKGREGREGRKRKREKGRGEVEESNRAIGVSIYMSACHRFHESNQKEEILFQTYRMFDVSRYTLYTLLFILA
jgi:hypothetical protein